MITTHQVQVALYYLRYPINDVMPESTVLQRWLVLYEGKLYANFNWIVFTPFLEKAKEVLENHTSIQELTDARTILLLQDTQLVLNATRNSLTDL